MSTRYTYKLIIGGTTYDAYPALNGAVIGYASDGVRRGKRAEMDGSLVFYNDIGKGIYDYSKIMSAPSLVTNITVQIYRDGTLHWTGIFNRYDCKIDEDRHTIDVSLRAYDQYYTVVSKTEIERNIITGIMENNPSAIAVNTITLQYKSNYPTDDEVLYGVENLVPQMGTQIPGTGGQEYIRPGEASKDRYFLVQKDYTFNPSINKWDFISYYKREYVIDSQNSVAPAVGFQLATDQSGVPGGSYKWVRPYQNLPLGYSDYVKAGAIDHFIFSVSMLNYTQQPWVNQRARKLNDVLTAFAVSFGLTFQSDILTAYTNYAYDASNSVVENPIRNIMMIQKSDSKKTSNAAWKGMISFNTLMKILNDTLNLSWFVEGTVLRIEHESWFTRANGIDLTSSNYINYIKGLNRYSYGGEYPRYETWEFMEAKDADFVGVPIEYTFIEGREDSTKERAVSTVTTDIEYAINTPDEISNSGWLFLCCDAQNYVLEENGMLTGVIKPNAHLSVANIQHHYFRHGRPFPTGKMNRKNTTFLSVEKKKLQENISFVPLTAFDPDKLVKTELGWGEVESATEDLKTETIKLSLKHD